MSKRGVIREWIAANPGNGTHKIGTAMLAFGISRKYTAMAIHDMKRHGILDATDGRYTVIRATQVAVHASDEDRAASRARSRARDGERRKRIVRTETPEAREIRLSAQRGRKREWAAKRAAELAPIRAAKKAERQAKRAEEAANMKAQRNAAREEAKRAKAQAKQDAIAEAVRLQRLAQEAKAAARLLNRAKTENAAQERRDAASQVVAMRLDSIATSPASQPEEWPDTEAFIAKHRNDPAKYQVLRPGEWAKPLMFEY